MNRFPPRKILVAYDFTQRSRQAWRYAQELAASFAAQLEAVHVASWTVEPEGFFIAPSVSEAERRSLQRSLDAELGGPGRGTVVQGSVIGELLSEARRVQADLIVMATEGRVGLRRLAFGSLTEALVRVSPIPVLTLHGAAPAPRSILAPVNLESYSMSGFHFAEDLARTLRLPLTLLHVRQDERSVDRLSLAADTARKLWGLQVELKVVARGEPVRRILSEARRHGLVVLVAHRRGLLRDGVLGTTAEQVLRRSAAPVLCVPALAPAATRRMAARRRGLGAPVALRRPVLWKA